MRAFKFELLQNVSINVSGEGGQVVGRAEYPNAQNSYLVRYKAGDGRAVQAWWDEDALSS